MKQVTILSHRCYNEQTLKVEIGGVETYAANLCDLFIQERWRVVVLQYASENKIIVNNDFLKVIGFKTSDEMRKAYDYTYAATSDLTIFLLFEYGIWCHPNRKSIIVQHGIEFDGYTCTKFNKSTAKIQQLLLKYRHCGYLRDLRKKLLLTNRIVCVDLNFVNYVRSTFRFERFEDKLCYIPNFSEVINENKLKEKLQRKKNTVRIIIPRRFEYHRGVTIYADVCEKLLSKYNNIEIAFIGEGHYEKFLHKKFDNVPQVSIYRADHEEVLEEYYRADICIIPTLYSEGTSLSAIEAMGNCCSLIVSNVGGLGNLVFPDFNGIICEPTVNAFYNATCQLIDNNTLRNKFIENAYHVAEQSFSLAMWKKRWLKVVKELYV